MEHIDQISHLEQDFIAVINLIQPQLDKYKLNGSTPTFSHSDINHISLGNQCRTLLYVIFEMGITDAIISNEDKPTIKHAIQFERISSLFTRGSGPFVPSIFLFLCAAFWNHDHPKTPKNRQTPNKQSRFLPR